MAVLDALKSCALLKGFTDTGLQILAGIAAERTFPRGAPLFVENMVAESLFIIGEGRVSILVKGNNGEEIPVGELGPGTRSVSWRCSSRGSGCAARWR